MDPLDIEIKSEALERLKKKLMEEFRIYFDENVDRYVFSFTYRGTIQKKFFDADPVRAFIHVLKNLDYKVTQEIDRSLKVIEEVNHRFKSEATDEMN